MLDVASLKLVDDELPRARQRQVERDRPLDGILDRGGRARTGGSRRKVEIGFAERQGPRDGVLELAHVAGPVVVLESLEQRWGERPVLSAERLPEVAGEHSDIAAPLAE